MRRLLVATRGTNGKMNLGSHECCLAPFPQLYSGMSYGQKYDRRVYVSTQMGKKAGLLYCEGFRKAYPEGMTIVRNGKSYQVKRPTVMYRSIYEDLKGSYAPFAKEVEAMGGKGYFVVNIPEDVYEPEAYLWLKLIVKPVSFPRNLPLDKIFTMAYKETGNWKASIIVMGLVGCNGVYHFPLRPTTFIGKYSKELLSKWVTGKGHTIAGVENVGHYSKWGTKGLPNRSVTTSLTVFPRMQVPTSSQEKSFTFNRGEYWNYDGKRFVTEAIKEVKQLLNGETK